VTVFDVAGRRVKTLLSGTLPRGRHTVRWSGDSEAGTRLASGVFFVRAMGEDFTKTRKVVLIR
jgi:hypothetical protein